MTPSHQHKIELNAQIRTILGSKVNSLRKSGYIPAVLYGKAQESISLQIPVKDFNKAFHSAGESTVLYLNVDGKAYPTLIHDIARDAASDAILHADFYKVNLSEKIKTNVAVVFIGKSQAVEDGGILVRNVNELEVEALPTDLPHEISVDITKLEKFSDNILLKDINLGPKVKIMGNEDEIVATVQEPISEEELKASLETPSAGVEDVEMVEKEKKEEEPAEEGDLPAGKAGTPAPAPAEPEKK